VSLPQARNSIVGNERVSGLDPKDARWSSFAQDSLGRDGSHESVYVERAALAMMEDSGRGQALLSLYVGGWLKSQVWKRELVPGW